METNLHTGNLIKGFINNQNIDDSLITTVTGFDQAYLSRIYTSRQIQPWKLRNFLFVLNRNFKMDITLDMIERAQQDLKTV